MGNPLVPRETGLVSGSASPPSSSANSGSPGSDVARPFTVAGGIIERDGALLLVKNRRRQGTHDWSPPGGVIDVEDDGIVAGLTREVIEETGLSVTAWEGPLYEVVAHAPEMGWTMRAIVYRAIAFVGDLIIDDPDGIVVEAAFIPSPDCEALTSVGHPWVHEPLTAWLADRWTVDEFRTFGYVVRGQAPDQVVVERT